MSNPITMIVNNEYIQWKDGDRILYDSRWTYEEFLNGGKVMNREQVIKYAREAIEFNKTVRDKNNNALSHAIGLLEKHDGEYERGLKDAWELARKIVYVYTKNQLEEIFDFPYCEEVINENSYWEALKKVKAYEKKKEEEVAKPVLGDVVEVTNVHTRYVEKGIFVAWEGTNLITYIASNGALVSTSVTHFKVKKTGEHVDIQGMLDKIGD